jgi:hypothetical protein
MAPTTKEVVLPPSFNLSAHLTFEVLKSGDAVVVRTVDESKEELAQLRKGDELVAAAGNSGGREERMGTIFSLCVVSVVTRSGMPTLASLQCALFCQYGGCTFYTMYLGLLCNTCSDTVILSFNSIVSYSFHYLRRVCLPHVGFFAARLGSESQLTKFLETRRYPQLTLVFFRPQVWTNAKKENALGC